VSTFALWPCVAGAVFLIVGLIAYRKEVAAALGLEKLVVLGPVFVAAPLATFGAEHLAGPRFLMQMVPVWMPARLFWAYFVGFALFAAALSFIVKKYLRWSATLLAIMFFLFVAMIHLPNLVAHSHERLFWTIPLRESAFAGGVLAFAGAQLANWRSRRSSVFVLVGRVIVGITLIFFGVENCLHPRFAPGVPLPKVTPAWVPLPAFWGYLAGVVLVVAGVAILLNRRARLAATVVGVLMTLLTFLLYFPILVMARGTPQIVEGVNYVADTLLFGGTTLLLASALRDRDKASEFASR
jgi:uncharacterized membrane protein YphA (DoxX/SURF4 family)